MVSLVASFVLPASTSLLSRSQVCVSTFFTEGYRWVMRRLGAIRIESPRSIDGSRLGLDWSLLHIFYSCFSSTSYYYSHDAVLIHNLLEKCWICINFLYKINYSVRLERLQSPSCSKTSAVLRLNLSPDFIGPRGKSLSFDSQDDV